MSVSLFTSDWHHGLHVQWSLIMYCIHHGNLYTLRIICLSCNYLVNGKGKREKNLFFSFFFKLMKILEQLLFALSLANSPSNSFMVHEYRPKLLWSRNYSECLAEQNKDSSSVLYFIFNSNIFYCNYLLLHLGILMMPFSAIMTDSFIHPYISNWRLCLIIMT